MCSFSNGSQKNTGLQSKAVLILFNSIQQVTGTVTYNGNMKEYG